MPTSAEPTDRPEAAPHTPPRWIKPALLAGACLAAGVVAVGMVSRVSASQSLTAWTRAQAIPTIGIIAPAQDTTAQALVLPGQVEAFYNASIHARVSGYLKHWYQDIGARVKAGQLLADIDTPELDQQLAQAKANLATAQSNQQLAQTTAARWAGLLAKDAVPRQEADEKTSDLAAKTSAMNAAKAEVDRLQALESFKRIVAPFDGVVTARTTDIGALIAAGAPNDPGLFTVSDTHRLRIYVHVPQSYSSSLKTGMTASLVVPDHPGQTFHATLASTSESVSTQSGTLLAELQTDNPDDLLKPGDYAQVQFSLPSSVGAVRVPASALMFLQTGMAVATVGPNSHVVMKPVAIAQDLGPVVEIATGLKPSDRVIDNPPDSLVDGDLVRISDESAARLKAARQG